MNVAQFVSELRRDGVTLTIDGDRLRWKGPAAVVTAAVVELLREHKWAIIEELLAERDLGWCTLCRRILVRRHLQRQPTGYRCTDFMDCTAAKLIADAYAGEQAPEATPERETQSR